MNGRTDQTFSFEFFPPKTEQGKEKLIEVARALAPLGPHFASVTFGAGGSSREGTFQTAQQLKTAVGLDVAPHLSCVGITKGEIARVLESYREIGVRRIVALRGDLPKDGTGTGGNFQHASELVAFIKETGGVRVSVGCYPEFHPEATDAHADLAHFARKVQAGADEAITQYFFNNDAYYAFVDSVRRLGIAIPIVVGLMPISDYKQIAKFSQYCGADIPAWIRKRMEAYGDDVVSQRALGIEIATRQAEDLLKQGAPGIHFYTLNKSEATLRIWKNLGLPGALPKLYAQSG